jgi:hypothetical protein
VFHRLNEKWHYISQLYENGAIDYTENTDAQVPPYSLWALMHHKLGLFGMVALLNTLFRIEIIFLV